MLGVNSALGTGVSSLAWLTFGDLIGTLLCSRKVRGYRLDASLSR